MLNNYKKWLLINYGMRDSRKVLIDDENLSSKVAEGEIPSLLELWIPSRECFVLGKNYAKKMEGTELINKVKKEGIPVVIRSSGGEAILHDSTCLNFGVIIPRKLCPKLFNIGESFSLLLSGVMYYLKKIKIPCYFGKTRNFCPGAYDILVKRKKIVGASLLLRQKFCLVHGTLFVNTQHEYINKIKIFYPSVKDEITSLRILKGKRINMEEVTRGIIQGYRESLNVTFFT